MTKRLALLLLAVAMLAAGGYYAIATYPNLPVPAPLRALVAQVSPPTASPVPVPAPVPTAGVVEARPVEVPLSIEFAGRIAGFRDVEVRPRVGGLLLKREFEEGAKVQQGQALFRIDPSLYQVALDRAEAQLAQAQAQLREAEENYVRIEELVRRRVTAAQQLDAAAR